jgi:hypothetical protein
MLTENRIFHANVPYRKRKQCISTLGLLTLFSSSGSCIQLLSVDNFQSVLSCFYLERRREGWLTDSLAMLTENRIFHANVPYRKRKQCISTLGRFKLLSVDNFQSVLSCFYLERRREGWAELNLPSVEIFGSRLTDSLAMLTENRIFHANVPYRKRKQCISTPIRGGPVSNIRGGFSPLPGWSMFDGNGV